MKSTTLLAAVLTLSVGAGSYAVVGGSAESPESIHRPITRVDLEASKSASVYDAVTELRDGWLIHDSAGNVKSGPTVYIELRCDEVTCMRWIEASQVERVEYLPPDRSGQPRHRADSGAVIVVMMRTRATGLNADSLQPLILRLGVVEGRRFAVLRGKHDSVFVSPAMLKL